MSTRNAAELAEWIASMSARGEKVSSLDLGQMNRVLELQPEDMTVTVETGIALGTLQKELERHGQWLPIDPPNAESVSIHEVLAKDLSGPRRFGYGTIREHLIGLKVVLADGRTIKSGGKVVKNVAGYDLAKLFIGAHGSLGIIVEATFKLRPLPQAERIVMAQIPLADSQQLLRAILDSELTPVILDMQRLANGPDASIVVGFAGTQAEVDWQLDLGRALGFTKEATLAYVDQFWRDPAPVNRISVLPSRLTETLVTLGAISFVARAGNGIIYHHGDAVMKSNQAPSALMRRIKTTYDPKNTFPELNL